MVGAAVLVGAVTVDGAVPCTAADCGVVATVAPEALKAAMCTRSVELASAD